MITGETAQARRDKLGEACSGLQEEMRLVGEEINEQENLIERAKSEIRRLQRRRLRLEKAKSAIEDERFGSSGTVPE